MPLACMILHGCRYYANQLRKDKRTDERVTSMRAQLVRLDPGAIGDGDGDGDVDADADGDGDGDGGDGVYDDAPFVIAASIFS